MISSPGVGSGLDVNSIIDKLMALERQPLQAYQTRKSQYNAQLSAYGKLKSAISSFQSAMEALNAPSDFKLYTASSSAEDVFTASADSSAARGSYDVEVTSLATADKMGSASFADADTTTVGTTGDQMTLTVAGQSFSVAIGGKTLDAIRTAINDATDNTGVTASIVEESTSSYRLTLTSQETGTANAISVSFADASGNAIADPLQMAHTRAATDATLTIDGTYSITRSSNTISDAISGVTLELQSADPGTTHTLGVSRDTEAVGKAAQGFVDAYNNLRKTVTDLRGGALEADSTLLSIENQLRGVLNSPPSGGGGSYSYLAEVGVSIQKNGDMALDQDRFDQALADDFNGVAELFGNDTSGYAARLDALAGRWLQSDGLIETRKDGVNSSIDSLNTRIEDLNRRLDSVEQRYRAQFTALDTLMGRLQTTSSYLGQQLASLPGYG